MFRRADFAARLMVLTAAACLAAGAAPAQTAAIPKQHVEVVDAYGGLMGGQLAAYVDAVGQRVAAAAGKPGQCGFHVLNSNLVNAFTAPPGCHVYISRGLLAIINSEDELAGVLGHEVGHVTAKHAGKRQKRSILTGLGVLAVGAITGSEQAAQLAGQAAQRNVLSYSRTQEFQSDDLAVGYINAAGYAPAGMIDVLTALDREDRLGNRLRGVEGKAAAVWARSHPLTSDRITRAAQRAAVLTVAGSASERPAPYLDAVDGMLYGDDPSQGFVDGRVFTHTGLGIGFSAPVGHELTNTPSAVLINNPSGARAQFGLGQAPADRLEDYVTTGLQKILGQTPAQIGRTQRANINGFAAVSIAATAQASSGPVEVAITAYAAEGGRAYHFVTLAPAGRGREFDPLINSFHRLDAREAAAARPRRIGVVTVRPGDTAESLARRMAFTDFQLDRFLMINGLDANTRLEPGRAVKLVTFEQR